MTNYKFYDWVVAHHPESIEEGWGKNLALAGGMAASAMGLTGCSNGNCQIPNSSYTSPDAGSYLPPQSGQSQEDDEIQDSEYTTPAGASFFKPNTPQVPQRKLSDFQNRFLSPEMKRIRQKNFNQTQQLRQAGRIQQNGSQKIGSGTFVQGELQ